VIIGGEVGSSADGGCSGAGEGGTGPAGGFVAEGNGIGLRAPQPIITNAIMVAATSVIPHLAAALRSVDREVYLAIAGANKSCRFTQP
jgi:hypothetical protein